MSPARRNSPESTDPVPGIRCRIRWAHAFRGLLAAREPLLAEAVHADVGKSPWEVTTQEILPLAASLRWHARHAPSLLRPRRVGGRPWWMLGQRHWSHRVPVGRVLVIATWNYPLQLAGIQLVQSFMAGNRTVLKPSERSPRSQRLLVALAREALAEAGIPEDRIECADASREAGRALLESERFDHVLFTGSTAVGREVAAACARTLTPSTLELSGRDSALVLADADPRLAARAIWSGVTMNAGQTCMAPRRAIVDRAAYRRFVEELRPLAESAPALRLADRAMAARCAELAAAAVRAGGRMLGPQDPDLRDGSVRPRCVVDCPEGAELAAGDHFGPAIAVIPADGLQDALRIHREAGQHLSTAVFTARPDAWRRDAAFVAALGSGFVTFNDAVLPTAHPGTSITGTGTSGWGPSRGAAGLQALTRETFVSTTPAWARPPEGEPSAGVQRVLRRFGVGRAARAGNAAPSAGGLAAGQATH